MDQPISKFKGWFDFTPPPEETLVEPLNLNHTPQSKFLPIDKHQPHSLRSPSVLLWSCIFSLWLAPCFGNKTFSFLSSYFPSSYFFLEKWGCVAIVEPSVRQCMWFLQKGGIYPKRLCQHTVCKLKSLCLSTMHEHKHLCLSTRTCVWAPAPVFEHRWTAGQRLGLEAPPGSSSHQANEPLGGGGRVD